MMNHKTFTYYLQQGLLASQEKRFQQAEQAFNWAKKLEADNWEGWYFSGCLFEIQKNWPKALKEFQQAFHLNPSSVDALLHLGYISACLNHWKDASLYYQQAEKLDQNNWEIAYELGNVYFCSKQFILAQRAYQKAHQLNPNSAYIFYQLAQIALIDEDYSESMTYFLTALKLEPNLKNKLPLHYQLGLAYYRQGLFKQALEHLQLAIEERESLMLTGHCYRELGQLDTALIYYHQVNTLAQSDTEKAEILSAFSSVLEKKNQLEQATEMIEQALKLSPDAYSTLEMYAILCLRNGKETEAIECLSNHLQQANLQNHERRTLYFRLAHLHDKSKQYSRAFHCLQQANQLKKISYSPQEQEAFVGRMKLLYSKENLEQLPLAPISAQNLIFIVGLPRSGSTLIEQILKSHSQVFGAGELMVLPHLLQSFNWELSRQNIEQLSQAYLNATQPLSHLPYLVDKMLLNYQYLGIISQLFPNCKIIHCQRHPLDMGLSCLFYDFIGQHNYSYDLLDWGHYYVQYIELMQHWTQVLLLPILTISYEEMVKKPVTQIQKLLNFCQLKWEEQCLNFHDNGQVSNTASYAQVQQPIYTHATKRYKNYDLFLQPLKQFLIERLPNYEIDN